jgi:hypothetical protein
MSHEAALEDIRKISGKGKPYERSKSEKSV